MIQIIEGNLFTSFLADPRPRVLAHVVNARGIMGRGFAAQVLYHYPEVGTAYFTNTPELGETQLVHYGSAVIANMCAMTDVYHARYNPQPLNMFGLEKCLAFLSGYLRATQYPIYLPKIGAGLARGNWEEILEKIRFYLEEFEVYIYEYDIRRLDI